MRKTVEARLELSFAPGDVLIVHRALNRFRAGRSVRSASEMAGGGATPSRASSRPDMPAAA